MNKENLIQFLYNTKLVSLTSAREIADHFQYKTIAKNQLHLAEDTVCDEYFFIENGFLRAYAHDLDGNEVTTNFCSRGEIVFEVFSFFNRIRSKENIQALTDCEGWYISYKQLNELFHALPEFREFGRATLVRGYGNLKIRMLSMITETAEERYEQLLKLSPHIFQHAPLKHIASYLGITDTSLSRIRKEFAKKH